MPVGDESKHRLFKKVNDDPTPPQASKTTCNFCQLLAAFVAVVAHLLCFRDITLGPIQHSFESGFCILIKPVSRSQGRCMSIVFQSNLKM